MFQDHIEATGEDEKRYLEFEPGRGGIILPAQ